MYLNAARWRPTTDHRNNAQYIMQSLDVDFDVVYAC